MRIHRLTIGARVGHALRLLRTGVLPQRRVFVGAESNRLTADWEPTGLTPDDEIRWSLPKLRNRARDLERNNPTMRHYLRLLAINVAGPYGIDLQAQVRDNSGKLNAAINEKLEEAWEEWCERPTRDGKMDMAAFERLVLKTVARDGECFVRLFRGFKRNRFGLALEAIDPDLIDETINRAAGTEGNEIRMGVEVDEDGRPVAYHGWDRPNSLAGTTARRERRRYAADEIIHLYDPERVHQSRGVTWCVPVLLPLRMRGGYFEAELVGARVGASQMGMYEPVEGQVGEMEGEGAESAQFEMEANPGTFGVVPRGYKLSTFAPQHPSSAFESFLKASGREVSTGLGTSYNAQFNDLENVNYSSIRAGLLVERDMWRTLQSWFVCQFVQPVYDEWLAWATLTSAVVLDSRDPRRFRAAKWNARGWAWVDPLKDVQAAVVAVKNGLGSRSQFLAEQGISYEDVLEELKEEQEMADEAGVDIAGDAAAQAAAADTLKKEEGASSDGESSTSKPARNGAGRLHATVHGGGKRF